MRLKTALTKKDIVIVLVCLMFLVINLGAISSGGRRRAKRILCLTNLRQLTLAWTDYAEDNDGKIVNGDPGEYPTGLHLNEIPWVHRDWARTGHPPLSLDVKQQAIKEGALWPYCMDLKLYKCPVHSQGETRSYCVVDAMNCMEWGDYRVMLKTISDILNPSARAVFLDDGGNVGVSFAGWTQYSIYSGPDAWIWWDPPPIRHDDGTTFSFADGHTEYWKWKDQRTVEWGEKMMAFSPPQPGNLDLTRSQIAVWGD